MGTSLDFIRCTLFASVNDRVATDLENLESQRIRKKPLRARESAKKVREFMTEFQNSGKSQGSLLSEIHFQPS